MTEHLEMACGLLDALVHRPGMYLVNAHSLLEIETMMHGFDIAGISYGKRGVDGVEPGFNEAFMRFVSVHMNKQVSVRGWANFIESKAFRGRGTEQQVGSWELFLNMYQDFSEELRYAKSRADTPRDL